ncbi:MAG: MATE family efflux transporter [Longimicrobiales bacterium]|nr:MATE family efflux transporter [Longimicrobiales bacterium]
MRLPDYRPSRDDLRRLLHLAAPVTVVQLGLMSMGAVDTIMVGRVSATDLAAVAIGNLYFFGMAVFGMGILYALDAVISQAVGADDVEGVARGVQRGLLLAVGLSLAAMTLLLPAGPLLDLARQPVDVVPVADAYAEGLILGVFPFYAFVVFRQSLQAMARVRPIVVTVLVGTCVNVFLNWILIFGNLGVPPLGAVGSAWGTSVSRWFMTAMLCVLAWDRIRPALFPFRPESLRLAPLVRFLKVGAPIGAQQWLEFGVFGAAGLLMGLLGTVAVASHQVALQLAALTFMVPVGVAQATSVVVGQEVGREDAPAARRAVGAGLLTATAFMSFTAAMFLLLPGPLARLFSSDAQVVMAAAALLPIAGVFQIFDGLQVAAAGALRGVGDTRVPMLLNLVGFWMIGLPACVGLAFGLGMGPQGIWWGLALGIGVVGILLMLRIRRRFGRALRRLVMDEEVGEPEVLPDPPPL